MYNQRLNTTKCDNVVIDKHYAATRIFIAWTEFTASCNAVPVETEPVSFSGNIMSTTVVGQIQCTIRYTRLIVNRHKIIASLAIKDDRIVLHVNAVINI